MATATVASMLARSLPSLPPNATAPAELQFPVPHGAVHSEPGDPWRTDNVVAQLQHGEVVESRAESGEWVSHDGGGWSIRVYEGHAFLVPLDS